MFQLLFTFYLFRVQSGMQFWFSFSPAPPHTHTATWRKFFLREEYCCFHPRHAAAPVIRFWYYKSGFPKMQYLCFVPPETKIQCIFFYRRSLSSSSFKGSVASWTVWVPFHRDWFIGYFLRTTSWRYLDSHPFHIYFSFTYGLRHLERIVNLPWLTQKLNRL